MIWVVLGVGTFLFLCGGAVVGMIVGACLPGVPVMNRKLPLVHLSTRDGMDGGFFLGTGTVEGRPVYLYYADHGGGRIIADTAPISSPVVEEVGDEGWGWWMRNEFPRDWMYWVGVPSEEWVEFHVPPGTVRRGLAVP